jgi:hypothetical protein
LPNLRISMGPEGQLDVGAVATVRKYLGNGPEGSLCSLASVLGS